MNKIADHKTRYMLLIEKDLKSQLEKIAIEENRSLNNLIITLLKKYVEDRR